MQLKTRLERQGAQEQRCAHGKALANVPVPAQEEEQGDAAHCDEEGDDDVEEDVSSCNQF